MSSNNLSRQFICKCVIIFFDKIYVDFLERPVLEECSNEAFALMNIKARYVGVHLVNVQLSRNKEKSVRIPVFLSNMVPRQGQSRFRTDILDQ